MDHLAVITILYLVGLVLLIAEIFVPSHGLLTIGALVCFGVAVFHTFARSTTAGMVGTACCIVIVPTVLMLGIKYVRYLPMGNLLAPPNPTAVDYSPAYDTRDYAVFLGKVGRAVTPLHPIGVCEFDGQRVQCVAESGMIEAGTTVVGIDLRLHNLAVRPKESAEATA